MARFKTMIDGLTLLVFLGLVTYVPELSLWLPRLLGML
jgi:C4-dicarboxylate transporter DctM subunit